MMSWTELERQLQLTDIPKLISEGVRPHLEALPDDRQDARTGKALKQLKSAFTTAFFGFGAFFFLFVILVPDTWWGVTVKFVVFPVAFFGSFLLAAWLNRAAIADFFLATQERFVAKSRAMIAIAKAIGLTYIAAPGGAPESLKVIQKIGFLRREIQSVMDLLDDHGGLEDSVNAAIDSGLLLSDVVVLGSEEQKARFYRQSAMGHSFEDGFTGVRNGLHFSAFEWIERVEDAEDLYHLLVVFRAPYRLAGSTQFRSRKTPWPNRLDDHFQDVQIVPESFSKNFRLRSTDQVEARTLFNPAVVERVLALAHGDPFRAVAKGNHLVIDVVGQNRFQLLDLATGAWSEASVQATLTDLSELLAFVDAMAETFMLNR